MKITGAICESLCSQHGYEEGRMINGKCCGIRRMLVTVGVFVGIEPWGVQGRICFDTWQNASIFLKTWDGITMPTVGDDGCTAIKLPESFFYERAGV